MVSMFDSNGSSWAAGPLHAGQSLSGVECLAVRTGETLPEVMKKGAAVGAIVGGTIGALVVGALLGWLVGRLINKKKDKKQVSPFPFR
jgi:predicted MFS family arabinose efflux permease